MNMLIKLTPGGADKELKLNYFNVCIDFSGSSNFGRRLQYHNQTECTVYGLFVQNYLQLTGCFVRSYRAIVIHTTECRMTRTFVREVPVSNLGLLVGCSLKMLRDISQTPQTNVLIQPRNRRQRVQFVSNNNATQL